MKDNKKIERKVNETFEVLNRIRRTEPKPFFYTRLMSRIEDSPANAGAWAHRIKYALYVVAILLVVNSFSIYKALERREAYQNETSIEYFIENYYLDVEVQDINLLSENEGQ